MLLVLIGLEPSSVSGTVPAPVVARWPRGRALLLRRESLAGVRVDVGDPQERLIQTRRADRGCRSSGGVLGDRHCVSDGIGDRFGDERAVA